MLRFIAIALSLTLMFSGATHGESGGPDRIIGLLALPQLFGTGPCDVVSETRPLALFESADGTAPIGEIRVDAPWKMMADGGCEVLEIGVHLTGGDEAVQSLPTREYGYEEAGAVVFARRGGRFKIALEGGAAWVEPLAGAEFHPMAALVAENLSYLTGVWDGMICTEPGRSGPCDKIGPWTEGELVVTVLGHRENGGRLWFEIELPPRESCGEPAPAMPRIRGWVSGHNNDGQPAIWFYSRGC